MCLTFLYLPQTLTPSLFIESVCTKPGCWAIMHLCLRGFDFFPLSTILLLNCLLRQCCIFFLLLNCLLWQCCIFFLLLNCLLRQCCSFFSPFVLILFFIILWNCARLKIHFDYILSYWLKYKRRYIIWCARRVSGITFIRYAQCQKNATPNNPKVLGSKIKSKGLIRLL